MQKWIPKLYQKMCVKIGIQKSLALFLDPGLGKTSILLAIFVWLKKYKKAKGALIIAPLNPLYLTWPDEIKQWEQFAHLNYTILHNRPQKNVLFKKRKIDIYLANPESIEWIFAYLDKIPTKDWPFDVLIVDESSKFKSTKSSRTKILIKYAKRFKRRYIANGTPTGNGYEGLFSQIFIVDLGKALGTAKRHYLTKYFEPIKGYSSTSTWVSYQLKNKNTYKKILDKIRSVAICLQAEDHITMPTFNMTPKYITLPKNVQKIYNSIEKNLFAIIDQEEFVAESAATKVSLLHQICNGSVYYTQDPLDESYVPPIKRGFSQLHKEKLKVLEDLIEEVQGKQLLIGYKYQSDARVLQEYFGKKITMFNAKTDKKKIQAQWNAGKIEILAGQIQSMGLGLNLQKSHAHIIALYSIISDFEL
ncbi:MAG: SNF2-related protein, partial [Gammaproteobacteria bacterium]|nr:SNF2-related protein [Gammaproteobacteria bacterium]